MTRRFPFTATLVILAAALVRAETPSRPRPAADRPTRVDSNGDPLPPGAVRRLGTVRFRDDATPIPSAALLDLSFGTVHFRAHAKPGKVYLSPDGAVLAFDDGNGVVRLCEFSTGKEIHRLARPGESHSFGCFSPDGKRLATIGPESAIQIWDAKTLKPLNRLAGHGEANDKQREKHDSRQSGPGNASPTRDLILAFWPDGNTLASSGNDRSVRLWDVDRGKELVRHQFEAVRFSVDRFSPDGKILARTVGAGQVELLDVATGKPILALPWQFRQVADIAFAPDLRTIALVTLNGVIHVFDAASGRERCTLVPPGFIVALPTIAFSPDSKRLASTAYGSVRLWDPLTGKELQLLGHRPEPIISPASSVTFSPDQKTLIVRDLNATRLWDLATGRERQTFIGHMEPVQRLAFSNHGKTLVSTGWDETIRLWDVPTGRQLRVVQGYDIGNNDASVPQIRVSRNGRTLASWSNYSGKPIRLWDLTEGQMRHEVPHKVGAHWSDWCAPVSLSPDGKILAAAGDATGGGFAGFAGGGGNFGGNFGGGGAGFGGGGGGFGGGTQPAICLHDVATGNVIRNLAFGSWQIHSLALSPDGKMLASTGKMLASASTEPDRQGDVRLWEVATGKLLGTVRAQEYDMARVEFSTDAKTLAIWNSRRIRLCETATCRIAWEWKFNVPKDRAFFSVHFIPDGRVLALGYWTRPSSGEMHPSDEDRSTIPVWDIWQRKEVFVAKEPSNLFSCAALSPDGTLLATASRDASILLWPLPAKPNGSPGRLEAKELERLWSDLAGADVPAAYQAIRTMVANPQQSIPFLKENVRSVSKRHIGKLIADLDDDEYAVREEASRQLAKLGREAEPALRRALISDPLEVRRRAQALLALLELGPRQVGPNELRILRATQVLEHAGTQDAIQLLQTLARGAPDVLAQEAKASLDRLKQQTSGR